MQFCVELPPSGRLAQHFAHSINEPKEVTELGLQFKGAQAKQVGDLLIELYNHSPATESDKLNSGALSLMSSMLISIFPEVIRRKAQRSFDINDFTLD